VDGFSLSVEAPEEDDTQGHIWMFALAVLGGAAVGGLTTYGGFSAYENLVEGADAPRNPKGDIHP
jgi:hypothetical protein